MYEYIYTHSEYESVFRNSGVINIYIYELYIYASTIYMFIHIVLPCYVIYAMLHIIDIQSL